MIASCRSRRAASSPAMKGDRPRRPKAMAYCAASAQAGSQSARGRADYERAVIAKDSSTRHAGLGRASLRMAKSAWLAACGQGRATPAWRGSKPVPRSFPGDIADSFVACSPLVPIVNARRRVRPSSGSGPLTILSVSTAPREFRVALGLRAARESKMMIRLGFVHAVPRKLTRGRGARMASARIA
jgi:hypothetical protein